MPAPLWHPRPVTAVRTLPSGPLEGWRCDGLLGDRLPGDVVARDVPVGPGDRARALRERVPRTGVVILETAAWIHLGIGWPDRVAVAFASPVRNRFNGIEPHCLSHQRSDVLRLGGIALTTPVATAADLARLVVDLDDPRCPRARALHALLRSGITAQAVMNLVGTQSGRALARRALAVLAHLETLGLTPDGDPRARERHRGARP